jgi:hypothetical protein
LDVSSVVDFPAGITVASPMSGNVGNGGPPGPPLPTGQGAMAGGSPSVPQLRLLTTTPPPSGAPAPPTAPKSAYDASTATISGVLSGITPVATGFKLDSFFRRAGNANCYGPSVAYENHPDASGGGGAAGQFPGGDLGLWTASTEAGEACAAAQLNARMQDVQGQVGMGLTGLAGLVAAYQATGATWPGDVSPGDSIDLTVEMQAAGVADVTFNTATMTLGVAGDAWSYVLDMDYGPADATKSIVLTLQHTVVDRDAGLFEGLLTYLIEDQYDDRNCRDQPSRDITLNGSVHYIKGAASSVILQARTGTACGSASTSAGANLLDDAISSSVLTGNAVNPQGNWADNFNVFTAEFNPETLLGNYSYAWQAGVGDPNTRVLAVGLETEAGGEAYFGFGDPVQTSLQGQIKGFICNWAGPGNDHNGPDFAKHAQRQALTRDIVTRRYVVADAASSNITYAPTNSCTYDGAGGFVYDRNVNHDLTDETASTAGVMPTGTALSFDLMTVADGEASIWDHILSRGYDLPAYP